MPIKTQEAALKFYGHQIRVRVCGICIENEQILLVCHKGIVNDNDVWLPPGGGVEDGEQLPNALAREFLEETGLEISVGRFLFVSEFIHYPLHGVELYFEVKVVSGALKTGHDPEADHHIQVIKEVKWVPVKNREYFSEELYRKINNQDV